MKARKTALESFYEGEVWRAHREAANATLLDNDNVLLLKPLAPTACFDLPSRQPLGAASAAGGLIVVTAQTLDALPDDALAARFETQVRPALEIAGAQVIGWMVSWQAVLDGQGIRPRSYDPLVDLHDTDRIAVEFEQIRREIRQAAEAMPRHADILPSLVRA